MRSRRRREEVDGRSLPTNEIAQKNESERFSRGRLLLVRLEDGRRTDGSKTEKGTGDDEKFDFDLSKKSNHTDDESDERGDDAEGFSLSLFLVVAFFTIFLSLPRLHTLGTIGRLIGTYHNPSLCFHSLG